VAAIANRPLVVIGDPKSLTSDSGKVSSRNSLAEDVDQLGDSL
jgi:hypothetical protein